MHCRLLSTPLAVSVVAITVAMIIRDYDHVHALRDRGLDTHLRRINGDLPVRHNDDNGRQWGVGGGGGGRRQGGGGDDGRQRPGAPFVVVLVPVLLLPPLFAHRGRALGRSVEGGRQPTDRSYLFSSSSCSSSSYPCQPSRTRSLDLRNGKEQG